MKTLYHYVHCPFCIRVRIALGYLDVPFQSIVLSYNDEKTPIELCHKKMLPIFKWEDGYTANESLAIIKENDTESILSWNGYRQDETEIEQLLTQLGQAIHPLCMPYWMYTPEFDPISRKYFREKKEIKRGPFYKCIQDKQQYLDTLAPLLVKIEENLAPYYKSDDFAMSDIILASHLWGLYIFPEFQFSTKLHHYLQSIKKISNFDYHQDFWRSP